jgi:hypothetical protein
MAFISVDADKPNHPSEPMRLSYNAADKFFAAACPRCDGYVLLTPEQAAAGKAQCFGAVILVSWP